MRNQKYTIYFITFTGGGKLNHLSIQTRENI